MGEHFLFQIEQATGRASFVKRSRMDIHDRLAVRRPRSEEMSTDQVCILRFTKRCVGSYKENSERARQNAQILDYSLV